MPNKKTGMPTLRELGTNPRAIGKNPRAKARNKWALRRWKKKQADRSHAVRGQP